MKFTQSFCLISTIICISLYCSPPNSRESSNHPTKQTVALKISQTTTNFKDYWYRGKAEITSYDLEQARYGEIHRGQAVTVFVTEPFSRSKQVKLDNPRANPNDDVSILKLNFTRKFNTGIYPYSTMQSVFTPVDVKKEQHSLKVSSSVQEWCGHTFQQLNLNGDHFTNCLFSYFESEGDRESRLEKTLLEDEIWSRIRIAPESLPTGTIQVIPSTLAARFKHFALQAESATATLSESTIQNDLLHYQLSYQNIDRKLSLHFIKSFPHEIVYWEEAYSSGWGANAQSLVTKGRKKKKIMSAYWSKNNVNDGHLRKELGLEGNW